MKSPHTHDKKPPKKYLCPTYSVRNTGWVIQPKCKVFIDLTDEEKEKHLDSGEVAYDEENGYYCLVGGSKDNHDENFGELNGELKQFDW